MKRALLLFVLLIILLTFGTVFRDTQQERHTMQQNNTIADNDIETQGRQLPEVYPISHASFMLEWNAIVIYNDPVGDPNLYAGKPLADLIFLSDIHQDHLSNETIAVVAKDETEIVAPKAVYDELSTELQAHTTILANNNSLRIKKINVTAVPMYNLPETEDAFHTKGRGNGYVLEQGGVRVYIAGDTGNIPEMRALEDIAMAFVPMNLPYTMSINAAADGVLAFAPEFVYPYHYRGTDGLSDVAQFKALVEDANDAIEVVLLDWYPGQ